MFVRGRLLGAAAALVAVLPSSGGAVPLEGRSGRCRQIVDIDSLLGVLYKPENLHGGRGPPFLVQNPTERTGKRRLEVRDLKCRKVSSFGLFSTDFPYGARYYQRSGGNGHSAAALRKLARRGGGTGILIEGIKGKWILVRDPTLRQGTIFDP
jgi:hypothetical protein